MSARLVYRVVRRRREGWALIRPDGVEQLFTTKAQAIDNGRRRASRHWRADKVKAQLVIHTRAGRIQTEHTYGEDPRRFKS